MEEIGAHGGMARENLWKLSGPVIGGGPKQQRGLRLRLREFLVFVNNARTNFHCITIGAMANHRPHLNVNTCSHSRRPEQDQASNRKREIKSALETFLRFLAMKWKSRPGLAWPGMGVEVEVARGRWHVKEKVQVAFPYFPLLLLPSSQHPHPHPQKNK